MSSGVLRFPLKPPSRREDGARGARIGEEGQIPSRVPLPTFKLKVEVKAGRRRRVQRSRGTGEGWRQRRVRPLERLRRELGVRLRVAWGRVRLFVPSLGQLGALGLRVSVAVADYSRV